METVKEFAKIGIVEMDKLLGEQRKWIYRIEKGPISLDRWYEFVGQAVRWEVSDKGIENVDIPGLYAVWLQAGTTFMEMGKIQVPEKPKMPVLR
tara:strand:- start:221 stop:502 length:282 start_codon:yes stop_codon:yes gene_type:complete